jgi:hypothetical protein
MTQFISATEKIYRELSQQSKLPPPKPARPTADATQITLTKADVDAILQRTRSGSIEELEFVIAHAKEFILTEGQRDQLCCDLTIAAAQRSRQGNGRRIDGNAEFISKVLGMIETPFGLVARSFVDDLLREGSRNISRCRLHRVPGCACWSAQRALLYQASANGERSPEGWAATRIRAALEQLELVSRPIDNDACLLASRHTALVTLAPVPACPKRQVVIKRYVRQRTDKLTWAYYAASPSYNYISTH